MKSYLEANTYGIGELITQRKLFNVPEHQRSYAWTEDHVTQFLDDIINAFQEDSEYFIGLITLLHRGNNWEILDGQQRLATTTMIYSAIKHWLITRGYKEDAKQIENEFIGVRQLGGSYYPRLTLSEADQETFVNLVMKDLQTNEIETQNITTSKYSSSRLLAEALIKCRKTISQYADEASDQKDKLNRLFKLSSYLEKRVKVVVVDVSSESNAYVIFEALNARGNELSALDLVKNYIYGQAEKADKRILEDIRKNWNYIAEKIEDKNADDFLKVFWTSRFGRVQIQDLFNLVKSEFRDSKSVLSLVSDLATGVDHYLAVDDPDNEIWNDYGSLCKERMEVLSVLGSRQIRSPILSALMSFKPDRLEDLLLTLIIVIIRYQIVGKRRTGLLEIACAKLARSIYVGETKTLDDIWHHFRSLVPSDDEFKSDFLKYAEKKAQRAKYFLGQLEVVARIDLGISSEGLIKDVYCPTEVYLEHVLPKKAFGLWDEIVKDDPNIIDECYFLLGNLCLLEKNIYNSTIKDRSFADKGNNFYAESNYVLTNMIAEILKSQSTIFWNRNIIHNRQEELAILAIHAWPLLKS